VLLNLSGEAIVGVGRSDLALLSLRGPDSPQDLLRLMGPKDLLALLAGANADGFLDWDDEDLPVADPARAGADPRGGGAAAARSGPGSRIVNVSSGKGQRSVSPHRWPLTRARAASAARSATWSGVDQKEPSRISVA
jgi:hypothetical protein